MLSMGAYSGLGGLFNRYKKRTSSKKKTISKTKYKKGTKTKSSLSVGNPVTAKKVAARIAKMPDQRMTRMEYKQGFDNFEDVNFPSDGRLLYAGFQNHGGYIPHLRTVAGSIVRDICGKNGVKFPTWNTGSSYSDAVSTERKRLSHIRFLYRGQADTTQVEERGDDIVVTRQAAPFVVRTLWEIAKDLSDQFHTYARAGMFPFAYEVLVLDDSQGDYLVKFRDDNAAQMSVTVRVNTSILATNLTQNLSGGHSMTDSDKVPLKMKRFIFRNSVPVLKESILTAAEKTLNFKNLHQISNSELSRGVLEMQHVYNGTEGFFNPFKSCPQGKVVFKNLRSTANDVLKPGASVSDKSTFAFVGSMSQYLKSTIIKDKTVLGSPSTLLGNGLVTGGYTFGDIKASTYAQSGEARLFCFERFRTQAEDGDTFIHPIFIRFAIQHQAEAYVQPFKAVPLPKCRVDTNNWDTNPGNQLG